MELEELQKLQSGDFNELVKRVQSEKPKPKVAQEDIKKQLDPQSHKVHDPVARQDKIVTKADQKGNPITTTVKVARLAVPLQKKIVGLAASFLCGNPIQLQCQPADKLQTDFLSIIKKVWDDNKLDYDTLGIAEKLFGETEVAELWYVVKAEPEYWQGTPFEGTQYRLRMKILAPSLGDTLYPVYDSSGNLIAMGREYKERNGDKTIDHFDCYTDTVTIKGVKDGGSWMKTPEVNVPGKIPQIYYNQDEPEWYDVQDEIDRFETALSNNADTNDYFGSPMMKVTGKVKGFADKGDSGKVIEMEPGADAGYLTWDKAPEATKFEFETLEKIIHDMTDTPNISFQQMKGLGTFSGFALKMLFMAAHMKAARKEGGVFGKGIQRRINFLKAALAKINVKYEAAVTLNIKPVFEYYLPKNYQEIITMITDAVGPGTQIMSQETAVRSNPLVQDADVEIQKMRDEGTFGTDIQTA